MGVEARMFVRNRGPHLSADQLSELSISMKKDFPSKSLLWPQGPEGLVLQLVRTLGEYRVELAKERTNYPGIAEFYQEQVETTALPDHLQIWEQDGPSLVSTADEQWIEVHLSALYFSSDYTRGPWPELRAVAEWLVRKFPDGEIWYGGDSSGYLAGHLSLELRDLYSQAFEKLESERRSSRD